MSTVVVSEAIVAALGSSGYQRTTLEQCYLLSGKYQLGKNMQFYIDKNQQLKEVEVWRAKDLQNKEVVYYSVGGLLGDRSPVTVRDDSSLCTLFKELIDPESRSFQDYLTLWTRGGGLFQGPLMAALVYHCPPDRTVSGSKIDPTAKKKNKRRFDGRFLMAGLAILTVTGIVAYLWKKTRDRKKQQEQGLAEGIALLNAAAEVDELKKQS